MIDVSNVRIPLSRWGRDERSRERALRRAAARACRVAAGDVSRAELRRRSVDARHPDRIALVCTVRVELAGGGEAERRVLADGRVRNARAARESPYALPARLAAPLEDRPVVVGAGSAGLFCALALAHAGLAPLLVERGDDCARRTDAVRAFAGGGALDPESNVQFGLGGAGTFSDGKLATGTKAPSHRLVLETFVAGGASPDILVDSHPHVGSDVLPRVVEHVRGEVERLGGEVRCRCRMTDLVVSGGRVRGVRLLSRDPAGGLEREELVPTSRVVVACGHSARDVFELLRDRGVALRRKPFAMGVRIEHAQRAVDEALYGPSAGDPTLGPAPYKLSCHLPGGRGVFTFCMCPGGTVVAAASEAGGVVTNGMSEAARDGANANAGLLVGVDPADLAGDDVLAGVALQRSCERAAFAAGGGDYRAPAQLVGDFLRQAPSSAAGSVAPTYPRGVAFGALDGLLPDFVVGSLREAIPRLGRRLAGFDAPDAVLTGVETRSSAPVRVERGDDLQSVTCRGLWPVGEGAGYAGGIMSAAADGLRAAEALVADAAAELETRGGTRP